MKKWLKVILVLVVLGLFSVGIFFTLKALGVTDIE